MSRNGVKLLLLVASVRHTRSRRVKSLRGEGGKQSLLLGDHFQGRLFQTLHERVEYPAAIQLMGSSCALKVEEGTCSSRAAPSWCGSSCRRAGSAAGRSHSDAAAAAHAALFPLLRDPLQLPPDARQTLFVLSKRGWA